jgi:hypothetical protein
MFLVVLLYVHNSESIQLCRFNIRRFSASHCELTMDMDGAVHSFYNKKQQNNTGGSSAIALASVCLDKRVRER